MEEKSDPAVELESEVILRVPTVIIIYNLFYFLLILNGIILK